MSTADSIAADGPPPGQHHWRSLRLFSLYRLAVALIFLGAAYWNPADLAIGTDDPDLFRWTSGGYLLAGIACLLLLERWRRAFNFQLTFQVVADVLFLTLLMHASGGGKSGLAMMILIVVTGAGLVGQGRMVLFHAAIATLFLLLEQAYRVLEHQGEVADFFRTGVTSAGFFVTASAARLLARRVILHENLARRRGLELADQVRINERVIRDMQDGVLVVDSAGRIRQSNPQAAALLGVPPPLPELLAASSPTLAHEHLARCKLGIETETILRLPATGGMVRARFLPPGEGGNTLIFLEDMGRLEEEAQQMKLAALGRLTANMAHEIRNPLAAISHAAELLGDGAQGGGADRLIRIIGENTRRLNRLVAEVMELGRRDRATPETITLRPFVQQLVEESSLGNAENPQRIALDIPATATVCFDRGHLHQVLTNLLENARHYASEAVGAVKIEAWPDPATNRIDIHLTDDGPGIASKARSQIFEPFFTARTGGTGLGLYIARELCDANGARLSLRENAPGAHFCLSCLLTCPERKPAPQER